jgi:hypothetical protein
VSASLRKITVLLQREEFDRFDEFCRERGFKKSTLLVRLLKEFLDREANDAMPLFDRTRLLEQRKVTKGT